MKSSALKLLAQKAKKRLSTAGQKISKSDDKPSFVFSKQSSYTIVANNQTIEEDPLFDKVKKLMTKENVYNPLGELTDYSIFNGLSQPEKEKYIMDIARRYNEIKEYFLKTSAIA